MITYIYRYIFLYSAHVFTHARTLKGQKVNAFYMYEE